VSRHTGRSVELAAAVLDAMRAQLEGTPNDSDRGVARVLGVSNAAIVRARTGGLSVGAARAWCATWAEAGYEPIDVVVAVESPEGRIVVT
jgi:hypothetical protein